MKIEVRSLGEIIHLLTPDGFIQIYIQSIDESSGEVRLGIVAPANVRLVPQDSVALSLANGNALGRREIMALLNLEEVA